MPIAACYLGLQIKTNRKIINILYNSVILERWDKIGCKIEKIRPCTQTNETTCMHLRCIKLLSYALIQPPNFSFFNKMCFLTWTV